jgi:hypothetical protein
MASGTIDQMLQVFAARYRAAVCTHAATLAVLGTAIGAALGWRLRAAGAGQAVWIGLPILVSAGVAAAAWVWARRRWIAREGAASMLDRTLGLQQRLVTAEEFARAATPPSLYPLLVQDTQRHVTAQRAGFPRAFDQLTGTMTVALLLLLLWPYLPQGLPTALRRPPAVEPPAVPPEQPLPPDMPTPPTPPSTEQQSSGAAGQQDRQSQQQSGQGQQDQQKGQDSQDSQSQQGQAGDQQRGQQQSGQQQGGQQQSGSRQQGSQQKGSQQQGAQQGSQGQQSGGQQRGAQQGAAGEQRGQQDGQKGGQQRGDAGVGQSTGGSDALKADIQELLKEVSGELKELQAQAESTQEQPNPGTGTDPNLYGGEEPQPAGGDPLAVELRSDVAPTAKDRSGAGIGRAGTDVARSGPKAIAEDAQLADQPVPEPPSARQPIPVEYRSVFDQMRRSSAQPASEAQ